jgi:hypothetical protein
MATVDSPALGPPEAELRELFGDYKAEWLRDRVFDLFTEPAYFTALEGIRPCVLMGGRGTGKTTALLRMSYQASAHFAAREGLDFREWPYVGLYYRINSNRVAPFRGGELDSAQWERVFAHFMNLVTCELVVEFLRWYREEVDEDYSLSQVAVDKTVAAFGGESTSADGIDGLAAFISSLVHTFEFAVNNVGERMPEDLSVSARPLDDLTRELTRDGPFAGKFFVFLLDELENLDRVQQKVVNTLVKHSGQHYTFKVGVKQGGFRTTDTLAPDQRLQHPADYALIDIADQLLDAGAFADFAERVCNARLSAIGGSGRPRVDDVTVLFKSLTSEEEAAKLGLRPVADALRTELSSALPEHLRAKVSAFSDLELYVMAQLATEGSIDLSESFERACANAIRWRTQFTNYRQAFLYTIRRGKTGVRKYYCGWDTVVQLAAGNVRLLMELVERCFVLAQQEDRQFGDPFDPEIQTRAFQAVGRQNLLELSGSVDGARLARLLLGLGRVFGVLAEEPLGHTPEATQFKLPEKTGQTELVDEGPEAEALLTSAVMELVVIRTYSTKATSQAEPRDYEYRVHPVYSPFFLFPSGRKRRITITQHELLALAVDTRRGVRQVIRRLQRDGDSPLAEHLAVYKDFYGDAD